MIQTIVFMGRPGAGKGVQAELLSVALGLDIFSVGARVREIARQSTPLGRKVKEVSESGALTPPWFPAYLTQEALFLRDHTDRLIAEGVGRSRPEAEIFAELHDWLGKDFRALNLVVSEETVTQRLLRRGESEGRADDTPDKIKVRLEHFNRTTAPAIDFLRSIGKLIDIDGEPAPESVHAAVMKQLQPYL